MGALWSFTGSTWFEIGVVTNFILWIVRNLGNLYSFFCITAFRNASTRKRRRRDDSPVKRCLEKKLSGALLVENSVKGMVNRNSVDSPSSSDSSVDDDDDDEDDNSDNSDDHRHRRYHNHRRSTVRRPSQLIEIDMNDNVTKILAKNGLLKQQIPNSQKNCRSNYSVPLALASQQAGATFV